MSIIPYERKNVLALRSEIIMLAQLQQVSPKNRLFHALIKFNLM